MWRDRKKGGSDMVKAVIFDMDGVLIDTEKWLNKYWRQAAAEAGYDMTVEDGLAIRRQSMRRRFCRSGLERISRTGRSASGARN